jgi:hypothetical protein
MIEEGEVVVVWCWQCKQDTAHVVVSSGGEITLAECETCGAEDEL